MLHTTRGIVLRTIRYNDKAVITTIYTELFGLQGYLVHNSKSKRSALLQPLTCLEITVQHKAGAGLQRIKEAQCRPVLTNIAYDTAKSSLAIFIAEVIYRAVKEEESNLPLYEFLCRSILLLDNETGSCSNFHLVFLMQLSRYLGFFPGNDYSETKPFFDLEDGGFVSGRPIHPHFIDREVAYCFYLLINCAVHEHTTLNISKSLRKETLTALMLYYRLHLQGMNEVRSRQVLEEVMG